LVPVVPLFSTQH